MKLYAIYDEIKHQFSPPIMCITDGQAWREYDQFILKDQYAQDHTQEFALYYLADYDENYGLLDAYKDGPQKLIKNLDTEDLIPEKEEMPF